MKARRSPPRRQEMPADDIIAGKSFRLKRFHSLRHALTGTKFRRLPQHSSAAIWNHGIRMAF
jgi:hypothetical protein